MFTWEQFGYALILTMFAGLSTGLGSIIVLKMKRTNTSLLSAALGFSAGVMIYVSFVEIFAEGQASILRYFGAGAQWIVVLAFFCGIGLIALIDQVIPEAENPHELKSKEDMETLHDVDEAVSEHRASLLTTHRREALDKKELGRTGIFSALAIAIHNFPEGLATFMSALVNPSLGLSIAVAIAIHNIPEGISVAVPIYYATGSRRKAFLYSFLSGLAEPIGAVIGALLLLPFLNDGIMGIVFNLVAGIMVYISLDELLPTAEKYAAHHVAILGVIAGMAVMAISLLIL